MPVTCDTTPSILLLDPSPSLWLLSAHPAPMSLSRRKTADQTSRLVASGTTSNILETPNSLQAEVSPAQGQAHSDPVAAPADHSVQLKDIASGVKVLKLLHSHRVYESLIQESQQRCRGPLLHHKVLDDIMQAICKVLDEAASNGLEQTLAKVSARKFDNTSRPLVPRKSMAVQEYVSLFTEDLLRWEATGNVLAVAGRALVATPDNDTLLKENQLPDRAHLLSRIAEACSFCLSWCTQSSCSNELTISLQVNDLMFKTQQRGDSIKMPPKPALPLLFMALLLTVHIIKVTKHGIVLDNSLLASTSPASTSKAIKTAMTPGFSQGGKEAASRPHSMSTSCRVDRLSVQSRHPLPKALRILDEAQNRNEADRHVDASNTLTLLSTYLDDLHSRFLLLTPMAEIFAHASCQADQQTLYYGIPCAMVLAQELRVSKRTQDKPSAALPTAETIRNLCAFLSTLSWVASPSHGDFQVCTDAQRRLSQLVDEVLSRIDTPLSSADPPLASDELFDPAFEWLDYGTLDFGEAIFG
ncbi:hypothetical protein Micbo1qcDRAFT_174786 [Microdochium bolleyi]|uniref:Uncharacterized protein n=1 Tax=Microdochium bolleyi TaxID=196109 RepID=A0A136J3K2_9PEZI|nr:hypothetical protein Micbo1qcDRAFT_174786 [Microdochium bolleyi]